MKFLLTKLLAGVSLLLVALSAMAADDIVIERVIGPEILTRYKHPASFTELANGDLYLAYYGGSGEYATDTAVYGARLPQGSRQWTPPRGIAHTPFPTAGKDRGRQASGWIGLLV